MSPTAPPQLSTICQRCRSFNSILYRADIAMVVDGSPGRDDGPEGGPYLKVETTFKDLEDDRGR